MAHQPGEVEDQCLSSIKISAQPNSLISETTSHVEERMNQKTHFPFPQEMPAETSHRYTRTARRPLSLNYRILLLFAAVAAILLAALQIIGSLSDRWKGFTTASPNAHYLWTFVLTLFGSFWARVEYRIKQLAPWHRLAKGPQPAEKTVVLDYISPTEPEAIFKAVKNKDYLVALAGIVSLLVSLLIVISTGLITLEIVLVRHQDASLEVLEAFKSISNDPLSNKGALVPDILIGIQYLNFSYPSGTTDSYTYQDFMSIDQPTASLIEATVDAFSSGLDCEEAELVVHRWQQIGNFDTRFSSGRDAYTTYTDIDVSAPNCLIKDVNPPIENNWEPGFPWPISTYGRFTFGACVHDTGLDANRIVIMLGQIKAGKDIVTSGNKSSGMWHAASNYTVLRSVQLICKPSSSITPALVTLNASLGSTGVGIVLETDQIQNSQLPVHPWTIADALFTSFAASSPWRDQSYLNLPNYTDQQFTVVIDNNNFTFLDLFVPTTLISVSTKFYRQVSAQVAKFLLINAASSKISGTIWTTESRLVVHELPWILMSITLGILAAIFLFIALLSRNTPALPQDPGSIAGLLAILQQSTGFIQLLNGMGSSSLKAIKKALSGVLVNSHVTQDTAHERFELQVSDTFQKQGNQPATNSPSEEIKWFRPFPITTTAKLSAFVIVTIVIAALEVVLQLSHRNKGLADVSSGSYLHYLWSFIPALIMVGIGLYFVAFDCTLRTITPYARLEMKGQYRDSLSINFLAKSSLMLCYTSVRTTHFAVFAATLATVLAKFLTIAVSGVYSVDNVAELRSIPIWLQDWFDPTTNIGIATSDGLVAGLVLQANMTYPQWTYDGLVFPRMGLDAIDSTAKPTSTNASSLHIRLPAIQGEMSCSPYDAETLQITTDDEDGTIEISINPPGNGPVNCRYGLSVLPNGIYGRRPGRSASAPLGTINGSSHAAREESRPCKAFVFAWGKMEKAHIDHITVLMCNESIQIFEVDTTFLLPEFTIDTSRPPEIDRSTRKHFYNTDPNIVSDYISDRGTLPGLDTWFDALVEGRDGIPFSHLGDLAYRDEVVAAIEVMQRRVRAQNLNQENRIPLPAARATSPINGTLTNPYRLRLIQDAASTRFLEGLLAAMLVCGITASYLMRTKQVLPKNPCSIAAVASLLADSELLKLVQVVPFDAEGATDEEMQAAAGFQKLTFRMGWFDKIDGQGQRFTIDAIGSTTGTAPEKEQVAQLLPLDEVENSSVPTEDVAEETAGGSLISEERTGEAIASGSLVLEEGALVRAGGSLSNPEESVAENVPSALSLSEEGVADEFANGSPVSDFTTRVSGNHDEQSVYRHGEDGAEGRRNG